jgi:hypothetical protein
MNRIEDLERQIDAELNALESTLDEYEQTLSDIDGTLSENKLSETESVRRESAPAPAGAD